MELIKPGTERDSVRPAASPATPTMPGVARTDDTLLNKREAAAYLKVSIRWLETNPDIPKVNLARLASKRAIIRYRKSDLDSYIAGRVVECPTGRGG